LLINFIIISLLSAIFTEKINVYFVEKKVYSTEIFEKKFNQQIKGEK
jgi:hypothetical protein